MIKDFNTALPTVTKEELLRMLASVRSSATPKEARYLDSLVAENATATDCAQAIMITPAIWSAVSSLAATTSIRGLPPL